MFQTRLEIKILLLLFVVLVAAFGAYLFITVQNETDALHEQNHEKSRVYTETLMTGIRNVMLAGKGSFARSLVDEARDKLTFGRLHIYNRDGKEVFLREGEGVAQTTSNPHLMQALQSAMPVVVYHSPEMEVITRYEPLVNLHACQTCHGSDHLVRGVLQLSISHHYFENKSPGVLREDIAGVIGGTLASAYRTIETAGQNKLVDTLAAQARQIPGLESFQIYDRFGKLQHGDRASVLPESRILSTIQAGQPRTLRSGQSRLIRLVPLRNEERCQLCHKEDQNWLGVLGTTLNAGGLTKKGEDAVMDFSANLGRAISAGFRSIMLVGKGGYVRNFASDIQQFSFVEELKVFNRDGSLRFVNEEPKNRPVVTDLLQRPREMEFYENVNNEEFMVMLTPLLNDRQCQKCHGPNHQVRAIVEVSSSMVPINAAIRRHTIRTVVIGVVTLIIVALVLHQFMKTVVVKPIHVIGEVASKVGSGNLNASANVTSKDELGELAQRMNEMVKGLRERFRLEKFVSQQTMEAVKQSDAQAIRLGGERRFATVLFSDIRGFTSFSEKVEPETVVRLLNEILTLQARVVKKYGGDVDKFVGDELVAVFLGDEMVDRSILCALEIQRVVSAQDRDPGEKIGIGIGINTGAVVMGAMGSEERMDFTVIGDVVNLGARLCSVAAAGQILVAGDAVSLIGDKSRFACKSLEPLRVKGKEMPVEVFEVRGVESGAA